MLSPDDSCSGAHGAGATTEDVNEDIFPSKLGWQCMQSRECDFDATIFEKVILNLVRNPNINSTVLFRADVLYDSHDDEFTNLEIDCQERETLLRQYNLYHSLTDQFRPKRVFLRRMVPRNPQVDKPILQTCILCMQKDGHCQTSTRTLFVYVPHVQSLDQLPWYHPSVKSLSYLHEAFSETPQAHRISLYFQHFSSTLECDLTNRLQRTGLQLLSTVHKHGQGQLNGYSKRVHHDQVVCQQRVQDRYTKLKQTHARRLLDRWVEVTEPSKHIYEDIGIAAFLIELWQDMYGQGSKSKFPGFVDIACGNGVLVDVLLREGYFGRGLDARARKTWSTFDSTTRSALTASVIIPQPLERTKMDLALVDTSIPSRFSFKKAILKHGSIRASKPETECPWKCHDGIFETGTFIISNHADELTGWTPLLASLSNSPYLCIPCCSHNLSGQRFRPPTVFNDNLACTNAPSYFQKQVKKTKSVAITISGAHEVDEHEVSRDSSDNANENMTRPETGDLKDLAQQKRSKQPSSYSALCTWVEHLSAQLGYKPELEMMRLPTTRNLGIIGRSWSEDHKNATKQDRNEIVNAIVQAEKAEYGLWIEQASKTVKCTNRSAHND